VRHDSDRRSGARKASLACAAVLLGKGEEHDESDYVIPLHVERAGGERGLELFESHA
jgi:hypothetical protein